MRTFTRGTPEVLREHGIQDPSRVDCDQGGQELLGAFCDSGELQLESSCDTLPANRQAKEGIEALLAILTELTDAAVSAPPCQAVKWQCL